MDDISREARSWKAGGMGIIAVDTEDESVDLSVPHTSLVAVLRRASALIDPTRFDLNVDWVDIERAARVYQAPKPVRYRKGDIIERSFGSGSNGSRSSAYVVDASGGFLWCVLMTGVRQNMGKPIAALPEDKADIARDGWVVVGRHLGLVAKSSVPALRDDVYCELPAFSLEMLARAAHGHVYWNLLERVEYWMLDGARPAKAVDAPPEVVSSFGELRRTGKFRDAWRQMFTDEGWAARSKERFLEE